MSMLSGQTPQVQPGTADDWPAWTNEETWVTGPDPEDSEWVASQNDDFDDDGPASDDPIWDQWASEAEHRDLMDRGLACI